MKRAAALALAVCAAAAGAAPGGADLEAAALKTAQTLGGVLRACPASFGQVGSPDKQCVGVGDTVEAARVRLNEAVADDLYGVWRSRDGQRSVYNWLKTAGGHVYLRLQPDPDGRAQTLVYLDLPPQQPANPDAANPDAGDGATTIGSVTLTPVETPVAAPANPAVTPAGHSAGATAPAPAPEQAPSPATVAVPAPPPAAAAAPASLAPVPFGRTLKVQDARLHGPDVLAVQNRLIALMRPQRAGQGDGWYGPITSQTVRVFQSANGLPATGVVDRDTWQRLFSAGAAAFDAPVLP